MSLASIKFNMAKLTICNSYSKIFEEILALLLFDYKYFYFKCF